MEGRPLICRCLAWVIWGSLATAEDRAAWEAQHSACFSPPICCANAEHAAEVGRNWRALGKRVEVSGSEVRLFD